MNLKFTRFTGFWFGLALACVLMRVEAAGAQPTMPPLAVTHAVADASGDTVTIAGANFGSARPFVTLDMVPLPVRISLDSQIVAEAPTRLMPPGEYLLTVSRGPAPADNGWFKLTIGSGARKAAASAADPAPAGQTLSIAGSEPAARVGDRLITIADVDQELQRTDQPGYLGLSRHLYDSRRRVADAMITDELLKREAAARGTTTEALLKEEIPKRIVKLPESAVVSLYQGLGDSTRGATLDQMRPAIREWLAQNTEPELARMTYIEELKKVSTRAELFLAAPRVRVEPSAQDAALGPSTAIVQVVAFGDFLSSDYGRLARAFGSVRETFGERVRIAFKHLPTLGPDSVAAAEAAQCANAQGRFWPFHDAMLARPGSVDARIKQSAADAVLDADAFNGCVDRGASRALIRLAADEAGRYDIHTSPSFLVNGRLAPTPPPFLMPFDYFKRLIEEELSEQAKGARPAGR
jgi:protein-disulfide isomerase